VSADITRTRSELLIKAGAEASLTKPLELDRFLDTVFEVLGSRRPRSRAA